MTIFEGTTYFSNVSSPKYQRRHLRLPKERRNMASATYPLLFLGDLDLSSGLCATDILTFSGPRVTRLRTDTLHLWIDLTPAKCAEAMVKNPRVCLFPTTFKPESLPYFFKAPARLDLSSITAC
jgi:hypothetical protein